MLDSRKKTKQNQPKPENKETSSTWNTSTFGACKKRDFGRDLREVLILYVMLKHVEDLKMVIWSGQHGFTKGQSYLASLIAFYDGIIAG